MGRGQTRIGSLKESLTNLVIGFLLSLAIQIWITPLFGVQVPIDSHVVITLIFTVASILRSYVIRRIYNKVRKE